MQTKVFETIQQTTLALISKQDLICLLARKLDNQSINQQIKSSLNGISEKDKKSQMNQSINR